MKDLIRLLNGLRVVMGTGEPGSPGAEIDAGVMAQFLSDEIPEN